MEPLLHDRNSVDGLSLPVLMGGVTGAVVGLVTGFLLGSNLGATWLTLSGMAGLLLGAVVGMAVVRAIVSMGPRGARRDTRWRRDTKHRLTRPGRIEDRRGSDVPVGEPGVEEDSHRGRNALDWMQGRPAAPLPEDHAEGRIKQRERDARRLP